MSSPVADIVYNGMEWASVTLAAGELVVTLYTDENARPTVPLDDAITGTGIGSQAGGLGLWLVSK